MTWACNAGKVLLLIWVAYIAFKVTLRLLT
jgi:hypothetical protein